MSNSEFFRHDRYVQSSSTARGDSRDTRSTFERDEDRLLYSQAFLRLDEVTQVAKTKVGRQTHNRLTHSLKVAQLAGRLAQRLLAQHKEELADFLDPAVCRAASYIHDLGHPPFGHIGEYTLDELLTQRPAPNSISLKERFGPWAQEDDIDDDGFEGNAQSFRIVTALERNKARDHGLGLSRATLNASLKYPWGKTAGRRKYGYYSVDVEAFNFARSGFSAAQDERRSLEAEIMDFCDDIAYCIHDVQDFFRIGLIPVDQLRSESGWEDFAKLVQEKYPEVEDDHWSRDVEGGHATRNHLQHLLKGGFDHSSEAISTLTRFARDLTGDLLAEVSVTMTNKHLEVPPLTLSIVSWLKAITRNYVIDSSALSEMQYGQQKILWDVYRILLQDLKAKGKLLPKYVLENHTALESHCSKLQRAGKIHENSKLSPAARSVVDYISSRSESEVLTLHRRLTGVDSSHLLG
ncbi:MAG: dNTP triphosphohydrolase [Armatimonadota bacterium]